ncbi:site-specific integrase [Enterococcus faecium]|uniref:site-specific integrase n=1 Tax=Enterococcus faecium TaxID=1352 RepID=UPI001E372C77|nr:site-specific integrase [Enterococcus faecium]MCD4913967.1 site-specific integrase [Enterococcus faecium]MCD5087320.1 site-specific integrase [Enterococcus faecium]
MATFFNYKLKNGDKYWGFETYLGKDPRTGKDIRTKRRRFKTKAEAQNALNKLLVEYKEQEEFHINVTTFEELYELWIDNYRMRVKPSSVAVAQRFCKNHILPAFGKMKLDKITVSYCQQQVNKWHGKLKQYAFLRKTTAQIFKFGVAMEVCKSNPMSKTLLPRKIEEEQPIKFYTKDQLVLFLDNVQKNNSTKLYTFFRLLAFTGMRKSEGLALQWEDINFFNKTLKIGKTVAQDEFQKVVLQVPKTKSSTRTIKLDDLTLKQLRIWKQEQMETMIMYGYNINSPKQFVFTTKDNHLYYPQAVHDWLNWIYKKTPMDLQITPHGFRHTHCSLLFESGASIKEVQERLGHKDIKTTMNIYAHVTPQSIKETGDRFAKFMGM